MQLSVVERYYLLLSIHATSEIFIVLMPCGVYNCISQMRDCQQENKMRIK
jgi:heme/copper-type cytochrome/quinol oxidase subunit 1